MDKNFTAQELAGHRISVTCPGPTYQTVLTDLETGYTIANAIHVSISGDIRANWSALQAVVRLKEDDTHNEEEAVLAVYNAHLTADIAQAESDKEHTTDPAIPVVQPEQAVESKETGS